MLRWLLLDLNASLRALAVACFDVAAFAGDFEDPADDFRAPLPPEDRLWRHPSELGHAAGLGLDPVAVRRRWLSNPPSKASAWTAGVVGALLATGLVALGTHLATALTAHPGSSAFAAPRSSVIATGPSSGMLGVGLAASIHRTGESITSVTVTRAGHQAHCLGIVVRSDGMVLVPAASITDAKALEVSLSGKPPSLARLVGIDRRSGIAVLHVGGVEGLPVPQIGSPQALSDGSLALAVTAPDGRSFSIGTLTSLDSRMSVGGLALADVVSTDVPATMAPPGSALVDARGDLVGMVEGQQGGTAVAVPSWIVAPVVSQLIADGRVSHGWLGVTGETLPRTEYRPAGVLLTRVVPGSAAGIAGLRSGDLVTSVDFQPVTSVVGLLGHLYGLQGGDEVLVGVERGTTDLFYRVILQSQRPAARVTS
jgi:S1-C subfamily serine protease